MHIFRYVYNVHFVHAYYIIPIIIIIYSIVHCTIGSHGVFVVIHSKRMRVVCVLSILILFDTCTSILRNTSDSFYWVFLLFCLFIGGYSKLYLFICLFVLFVLFHSFFFSPIHSICYYKIKYQYIHLCVHAIALRYVLVYVSYSNAYKSFY